MAIRIFFLLLLSAFIRQAHAQSEVWSTDIAPILYNNCVSCHRPTGAAPFSLLGFQDAVIFSNAMAAAVTTGRMPPWPPDPAYSRMAHERILSANEIQQIVNWVNNGKPQGDPVLAPPVPVFNNNGELPGQPDMTVQIPAYASTAQTGDVYQSFVIPSGLAAARYITAFEAVPGNRAIVHHVLVYADTTGICAQLDAATPEPGYSSFGGVGSPSAKLIGGWVPGSQPQQYPSGFGVRLPPNADIVIQIHYPAGTAGMEDSTKINFFFAPGFVRPVVIEPALNHTLNLVNGPLVIPANETRTFTEHYAIPAGNDYTVLGMAPHMHLIGKNIHSFVVSPQGDTTKLIRINNWNFHWQGFYMLPQLLKVSGGSDLYATAFFDNTPNNTFNPNNPPQTVTAGEATTDEMMLVYFIYTLYLPGDENIIVDTLYPLHTPYQPYYRGQQLLQVYPNPATDKLVIKCHTDRKDICSIDLIGMNGQIVKRFADNLQLDAGYNAHVFSVTAIPPGIYQLRMITSGKVMTERLLIQQ